MFNESDPILGPSTLETDFLEEDNEDAQGRHRGEEEGGTLEECLGLPPSSPTSHPAGDSVEPLSSSYMLFKVCFGSSLMSSSSCVPHVFARCEIQLKYLRGIHAPMFGRLENVTEIVAWLRTFALKHPTILNRNNLPGQDTAQTFLN